MPICSTTNVLLRFDLQWGQLYSAFSNSFKTMQSMNSVHGSMHCIYIKHCDRKMNKQPPGRCMWTCLIAFYKNPNLALITKYNNFHSCQLYKLQSKTPLVCSLNLKFSIVHFCILSRIRRLHTLALQSWSLLHHKRKGALDTVCA
jgi:hypothetical protein